MKEEAEAIAKDIYNDFYLYSAHQNSAKVRHGQAIFCSLKCVDRIIEALRGDKIPHISARIKIGLYQEVRAIIEKY